MESQFDTSHLLMQRVVASVLCSALGTAATGGVLWCLATDTASAAWGTMAYAVPLLAAVILGARYPGWRYLCILSAAVAVVLIGFMSLGWMVSYITDVFDDKGHAYYSPEVLELRHHLQISILVEGVALVLTSLAMATLWSSTARGKPAQMLEGGSMLRPYPPRRH